MLSSRKAFIIEQHVLNFVQKHLVFPLKNIALLCSGGSDSTALIVMIKKFAEKHNIQEVTILYFKHQQRSKEEYNTEEAFVHSLAKQYNFSFQSIDIPYVEKNIEHCLREFRKNFLKTTNFSYIFTAHHLDDCFEWSFLKSITTSRLQLGMPVKSGNIFKPFFCLSKKNILTYLQEHQQLYHEDSSNQDTRFERNFLRKELAAIKIRYPRYLTHYVEQQKKLRSIYSKKKQPILKYYTKRPKFQKIFNQFEILKKKKSFFSLDLEKDYKLYFYKGKALLDKGLKKNFSYQESTTQNYSLQEFEKINFSKILFPYYIALDFCPFHITLYKNGIFKENIHTKKMITTRWCLLKEWRKKHLRDTILQVTILN